MAVNEGKDKDMMPYETQLCEENEEDISDYDIESDIDDLNYKANDNQHNDDVERYASATCVNVADLNYILPDNNDNILSVECEVDDILCLLDDNNKNTNDSDISDEYIKNIISSADVKRECDSAVRLTDIE